MKLENKKQKEQFQAINEQIDKLQKETEQEKYESDKDSTDESESTTTDADTENEGKESEIPEEKHKWYQKKR